MVLTILLTIAAAVLFAEFFGYWLHILLHSNKVEWLSRSHMQHHLVAYHPSKPLRNKGIDFGSTDNRLSIAGLGMEWIIPITLMLAGVHAAMYLLSVPLAYQALFTASALAWSYVLFGYMHDAMHLQDFWMETHPIFKYWYFAIRRNHDIHHFTFSDEGHMTTNYGICFFWFDRVFRTLTQKMGKFNKDGLHASEKLYSFIYT